MPEHQEAVAVPVGRGQNAPGGDPLRGRSAAGAFELAPADTATLTPLIDIYEGEEGLVLEADLPGVAEDQLTIQLEENVLNLFGKVVPRPLEGAKVLHEECRPGNFWRSFILSDEVDRSRITASLKDGVLRITMPKADRSRTRRIEIKRS